MTSVLLVLINWLILISIDRKWSSEVYQTRVHTPRFTHVACDLKYSSIDVVCDQIDFPLI